MLRLKGFLWRLLQLYAVLRVECLPGLHGSTLQVGPQSATWEGRLQTRYLQNLKIDALSVCRIGINIPMPKEAHSLIQMNYVMSSRARTVALQASVTMTDARATSVRPSFLSFLILLHASAFLPSWAAETGSEES